MLSCRAACDVQQNGRRGILERELPASVVTRGHALRFARRGLRRTSRCLALPRRPPHLSVRRTSFNMRAKRRSSCALYCPRPCLRTF